MNAGSCAAIVLVKKCRWPYLAERSWKARSLVDTSLALVPAHEFTVEQHYNSANTTVENLVIDE